jgi:hypothetical protein
MNLLFIMFFLISFEFCLYVSNNIFRSESDIHQAYSWWIGLPSNTYATPFLDKNSSHNIHQNETNLGRTIAECYLDPLCFKLEVP